ncbi:MAG: DUF58 domain-containing protein [Planctomycetaceae bacterium]|jgi:uncharacterized protein (DUF58 family)|nr:DUF58 domain-containing protein [Planctomycetaceae bacterium]
MKFKTTLSREGVYFLFVAVVFMVGSIVREVNPMLLLAAALFAIMPTAGWIGRYSLRGITVQRKLPDRVFAGEPFVVHVELSKHYSNFRYDNSETESKLESESESKSKSDSETESKSELNSKPESESQSESQSGAVSQTTSNTKSVLSAQIKTKNKASIDSEKKLRNHKSKIKKIRTPKNTASWGIVVSDKIQSANNEITDETLLEIMPYEPAVYFEFIADHSVVRKTYAGKLSQRGQYKFGPMTISTRFPFGFFRHSFCQTGVCDGDEFCVFPKIGRLSPKWHIRRTEAAINRQRYIFRPSRNAGEFLGVRRWLSGDTKKWIHWRASAKHGQPFVRQFETKQNQDCAVLLDIYEDYHESNQQIEADNFELAISFAATLVSDMMRRGGCNLFFATSKPNEENLSGPICLPLVESVLRRLATTKYEPNDNLPKVIIDAITQLDPGADIILISPKNLNLNNAQRFKSIKNDPKFRTAIQRIKLIDTSSPELDQYFLLQ